MTVMIEGPYRGKHLRGRTVAQRYAEGERNFRGAILRGANLQGQTLSQADFSGSDLRGANFEWAVLQRAYFDQTRGGLQRRWWLAKVLGAIALAAGVGFVPPLLAVPPAAAAVADGDPRSAVGMALVVLFVAIPVVLLARDSLLGGLVRLTGQQPAENLVMAAMLCLPFTAMGLLMPLSASGGAASPTAALAQLESMEIAILALLLVAPLGFAVADGETRQAEWGDLLGVAAVALGGV
ncbi:pentapeptide repeat-containing protein, partial [Nodosilinea sp. LEGE 07298]|uniref:pentapeptide repeat-containing protein n=1 Tax=Nodosilinea sp. LEGE 07298 TaxID=2777970 RepID=UPI00187ECD8E